jgi:hypothetical protein
MNIEYAEALQDCVNDGGISLNMLDTIHATKSTTVYWQIAEYTLTHKTANNLKAAMTHTLLQDCAYPWA